MYLLHPKINILLVREILVKSLTNNLTLVVSGLQTEITRVLIKLFARIK